MNGLVSRIRTRVGRLTGRRTWVFVKRLRYWRHLPVIRWWWLYVRPERCMSCGERGGDHDPGCYFA